VQLTLRQSDIYTSCISSLGAQKKRAEPLNAPAKSNVECCKPEDRLPTALLLLLIGGTSARPAGSCSEQGNRFLMRQEAAPTAGYDGPSRSPTPPSSMA
jgi:hypothetical protein